MRCCPSAAAAGRCAASQVDSAVFAGADFVPRAIGDDRYECGYRGRSLEWASGATSHAGGRLDCGCPETGRGCGAPARRHLSRARFRSPSRLARACVKAVSRNRERSTYRFGVFAWSFAGEALGAFNEAVARRCRRHQFVSEKARNECDARCMENHFDGPREPRACCVRGFASCGKGTGQKARQMRHQKFPIAGGLS